MFNVKRGFGSWGALMHAIHEQRKSTVPANALKLYDSDGAEVLGLDEVDTLEERKGDWTDELIIGIVNRRVSTNKVDLFTLVVDVGLGYRHSIPGVRVDTDCTALAKRVCGYRDICYLRKVLLTKVEAMVRGAVRAELAEPKGEQRISLYDLEKKLGKALEGPSLTLTLTLTLFGRLQTDGMSTSPTWNDVSRATNSLHQAASPPLGQRRHRSVPLNSF